MPSRPVAQTRPGATLTRPITSRAFSTGAEASATARAESTAGKMIGTGPQTRRLRSRTVSSSTWRSGAELRCPKVRVAERLA